MNVEAQFTRVLVMAVPVAALLAGSVILFLKRRELSSFLQLIGASFLVIVVLAHFCEALHLLPSMGWGLDGTPGHYLDAGSFVLGLTLFPLGYLLHALNWEPQRAIAS